MYWKHCVPTYPRGAGFMHKGRNIHWHWLVVPVTCCGEFSHAPLPGSLDACREDGPKGTFILGHTHTQTHTHTHICTHASQVFLLMLTVYSCVCVSVCASMLACFHCCLNLLFQDKVDSTNPLYRLSPSFTFHTLPFLPLPVPCSCKMWRLSREWKIKCNLWA